MEEKIYLWLSKNEVIPDFIKLVKSATTDATDYTYQIDDDEPVASLKEMLDVYCESLDLANIIKGLYLDLGLNIIDAVRLLRDYDVVRYLYVGQDTDGTPCFLDEYDPEIAYSLNDLSDYVYTEDDSVNLENLKKLIIEKEL